MLVDAFHQGPGTCACQDHLSILQHDQRKALLVTFLHTDLLRQRSMRTVLVNEDQCKKEFSNSVLPEFSYQLPPSMKKQGHIIFCFPSVIEVFEEDFVVLDILG